MLSAVAYLSIECQFNKINETVVLEVNANSTCPSLILINEVDEADSRVYELSVIMPTQGSRHSEIVGKVVWDILNDYRSSRSGCRHEDLESFEILLRLTKSATALDITI